MARKNICEDEKEGLNHLPDYAAPDQLAEVKAVVPRITRRKGWSVLNGDDPLVAGDGGRREPRRRRPDRSRDGLKEGAIRRARKW